MWLFHTPIQPDGTNIHFLSVLVSTLALASSLVLLFNFHPASRGCQDFPPYQVLWRCSPLSPPQELSNYIGGGDGISCWCCPETLSNDHDNNCRAWWEYQKRPPRLKRRQQQGVGYLCKGPDKELRSEHQMQLPLIQSAKDVYVKRAHWAWKDGFNRAC